jgi:hypothetical protein
MGKRKGADEIRRTIEEFQRSGLERRAFCERHGISVSTLDYWRRRRSSQRLVEVEVAAGEPGSGFTVILANGRRIESSWRLARC